MTLLLLGDIMKNIDKKYFGMLNKLVENPAIYLMAKNGGLDFLFYDLEHGLITMRTMHDLVLFGNNIGMPTFIRVGELSRKEISNALDCGATGVMVPMIETREQAEKLVQWSKYPSIGQRSYSSGANTNYGSSGGHEKNILKINQETVTIAQIETVKGVENVEEIASLEGIDAIILGPVDLSISMGNVGDIMHVDQLTAIKKVISACKENGKTFGIIGSNAILEYFKNDINYFVSAIDANLVREGIKAAVAKYKEITE